MDTGNRIYITMEDTLKYLNSNIDDIINNEKEPVRTYRLESMRDNFKNSVVSFEFTTIIDRLNNFLKEIIVKVKCVSNRGYYNLTEGKEYDVIQMIPAAMMENGFVFPKYVEVIGDDGNNTTGHAYRFETLDGISCEKYIK